VVWTAGPELAQGFDRRIFVPDMVSIDVRFAMSLANFAFSHNPIWPAIPTWSTVAFCPIVENEQANCLMRHFVDGGRPLCLSTSVKLLVCVLVEIGSLLTSTLGTLLTH